MLLDDPPTCIIYYSCHRWCQWLIVIVHLPILIRTYLTYRCCESHTVLATSPFYMTFWSLLWLYKTPINGLILRCAEQHGLPWEWWAVSLFQAQNGRKWERGGRIYDQKNWQYCYPTENLFHFFKLVVTTIETWHRVCKAIVSNYFANGSSISAIRLIH